METSTWLGIILIFFAWRIYNKLSEIHSVLIALSLGMDARFGLEASAKHEREMAKKYPDY